MGPVEQLKQRIIRKILVGSRVILWGASGCGKTSLIEQISIDLGRMLVTIIPALSDPTDINGFPIPNREHRTSSKSDRTYPVIEFAPRRSFLELNNHPGGGILYFDELTGAPQNVQSAVLRTMTDGTAGDFEFHKDVAIVAAANPPDEAVNGQELGGPMVNRLSHFHFPVYTGEAGNRTVNAMVVNEWADNVVGYWGNLNNFWRVSRHVGNSVIVDTTHMIRALQMIASFLRKRPQLWHVPNPDVCTEGWPSARSWVAAAKDLTLTYAYGEPLEAALDPIAAAVGIAAAMEFHTWARDSDLPDPEEVLAQPATWKFSGRPDIDYAVLIAVVAAVQSNLTVPRVLAALEIAGRSTDRVNGPVKEAAMVAIRPLIKTVAAGSSTYKTLTKGMDASKQAAFNKDISDITKKFRSITDLISS
jgi:hypothetical protein